MTDSPPLFFFFLLSDRAQTQDLVHTRQALCHPVTPPEPNGIKDFDTV